LKTLKNFLADESGMETLEYALIAGLIAIVALFVYINSSWKSTLLNRLNNAASAS
jgi:Flp pilus assembly pilin Flp